MKRTIALDVGERRIGVAASDLLGLTAQGVAVVQRTTPDADLNALSKIIADYQAAEIVIGLPLNMNGTHGPQAAAAQEFGELLARKVELPITYVDERLSTAAAQRTLLAADTSRKKRKQVVDMLAAQIILETYMARKNPR